MPSTPVYMIGMMIVSGYIFKKMSENPLPSGLLSRHGVKEKHQPLYQKLVLNMANPVNCDTRDDAPCRVQQRVHLHPQHLQSNHGFAISLINFICRYT